MKIKIKLAVLALIITVIGTSSSISAMDSRVSASDCWVVYNSKTNQSKAARYVTSKSLHYCSVRLLRCGNTVATSSRVWGYGKVSNSISYIKCGWAGAPIDGAKVYYGFL